MIDQFGFAPIETGKYLQDFSENGNRIGLQEAGETLDRETQGAWVAQLALRLTDNTPQQSLWILDSVRRENQIEHFRGIFGKQVLHAHLKATSQILMERYEARRNSDSRDKAVAYDHAKESETEKLAAMLGNIADVVFSTGSLRPSEIAGAIAAICAVRKSSGD